MLTGALLGNVGRLITSIQHLPQEFITEPWFDSRLQGCASDGSVRGVLPSRLGLAADNHEGTRVRFVENASLVALAEGDVLIPVDLVASAAITGSADGKTLSGFVGLRPNEWMGGLAYVSAAATGDSSCARITGNTATEVFLERSTIRSGLAAVTGATVQLFHPWRVQKSKAALGLVQAVSGVCYGAIPAQSVAGGVYAGGVSYYGLMVTRGIAERVKVDAATGAGGSQLLVPSNANAGQAEVVAAGATLDVGLPFARVLGQMENFDVAVPADIRNVIVA